MANHLLRPGAVVLVSAAVAAAIAVYESPQARQFAYDLRRRLAIALHSLGDELAPSQPRYNRPEDAEGFQRSSAQPAPGIDADEESKRRQREELMYWNALHIEKKQQEQQQRHGGTNASSVASRPVTRSGSSSFEDFLQQAPDAEDKGTLVYNSGAEAIQQSPESSLIHRRTDRGHPFASTYPVDVQQPQQKLQGDLCRSSDISEKLETLSEDLYNASDYHPSFPEGATQTQTIAETIEQLIDTSTGPSQDSSAFSSTELARLLQHGVRNGSSDIRELQPTQSTSISPPADVYASIHAWADHASRDASSVPYVSAPETPNPSHSEELLELDSIDATVADLHARDQVSRSASISAPGSPAEQVATPTDSMSLAGSAAEMWQTMGGDGATDSEADVLSIEGVSTPGTWTEVGSQVSSMDRDNDDDHIFGVMQQHA